MSIYPRAQVTPDGGISLKGGQRYFIDTTVGDYREGVDELSSWVRPTSEDEMVVSGRGQIMVDVRPSFDVVIPNWVAQRTGHFWELPDEQRLQAAQRKLYGDTYNEPAGVFDWLAANAPDVLSRALEMAEIIDEVADEVVKKATSSSRIFLYVAGGSLAAYLLWMLATKRGSNG